MDDLIAFWCARLDEVERVAVAATDPRANGAPEHWRWECTEDDEPVDVDLAIASNAETLDHDDDHYRIGLRSVEEYQTGNGLRYGHLVIDGEEVRPRDARHIALHDPARTLRDIEADRRLLAEVDRLAGDIGWDDAIMFAVKCRAAVFADHPDYRQEWKP